MPDQLLLPWCQSLSRGLLHGQRRVEGFLDQQRMLDLAGPMERDDQLFPCVDWHRYLPANDAAKAGPAPVIGVDAQQQEREGQHHGHGHDDERRAGIRCQGSAGREGRRDDPICEQAANRKSREGDAPIAKQYCGSFRQHRDRSADAHQEQRIAGGGRPDPRHFRSVQGSPRRLKRTCCPEP